MIKVLFQSGESVSILTDTNAAAGTITRMLKHLQHAELPDYPFDNPYRRTHATAAMELLTYANRLGISLEIAQLQRQEYLNHLHHLYEIGYNGHSDWLHYHEAVHVYEQLNSSHNLQILYAQIDYRELSGPLNIKVTQEHLDSLVTTFPKGMCCIDWTELGKSPYEYWHNGEPNSIDRMCVLSKPWLNLKPKLKIVMENHTTLPENLGEFDKWFGEYKHRWCQHWNLKDYTHKEIFGRISIGHIDDIDKLDHLLKNNDRIVKLTLNDYSNTVGAESVLNSK